MNRNGARVTFHGWGLDELREWIDRLAALTADERSETYELPENRADVILPAALLYERVVVLAGVDEITVPRIGVKEGLLLDLVGDLTGPSVHASRPEHEALHEALALDPRDRFDEGGP